jgi:hypothetical protein
LSPEEAEGFVSEEPLFVSDEEELEPPSFELSFELPLSLPPSPPEDLRA